MISSKFAAFLQNIFPEEHLWRAASGHLHYNKKSTVSCFLSLFSVIIHQSHSYTKNLTLIPFIPTSSSPHFHPDSHHPTLIPRIPTLIPRIPTPILRIPTLIPCIPIPIPCISILIPRIPTPIPRIPTLIPAFPPLFLAFPP